MSTHGQTINRDVNDELPDDFDEILHEVTADCEEQTSIANASECDCLVEELRGIIMVTEIDLDVRKARAETLAS